ncbi:ABC-type microcin C transport system permease subunit YejE [Peribacillus frigoritolerans]
MSLRTVQILLTTPPLLFLIWLFAFDVEPNSYFILFIAIYSWVSMYLVGRKRRKERD